MRSKSFHCLLRCSTIIGLCVAALGLAGCPPPKPPDANPNENESPNPLPTDIEVEMDGNGTVAQVWDGSAVTLTAVPDEGWRFDAWFGSEESQENPLTITPTDTTSIGARFVLVDPEPTDSDGDGVTDDVDQCPDTPADAEVDEDGCADSQKDTDDDGVTDELDQCPNTPADAEVGDDGCAGAGSPDVDGDGVADRVDRCPNTPVGAEVDENGCADSQKDADNDGVTDDLDQCPETPADTEVGEDGCAGAGAPDSDGDGVPDSDDLCGDTPTGAQVDENGCADNQNDSDGDGVTDDLDQCPNTPEGTNVDAVGCEDGGTNGGGNEPVCGNGVRESGEQCEPPNTATCDANCQSITAPVCGNGIVETGETCDPPDGVTCDTNCQTITGPVCGDSVVDDGEECDPPDGTTCDDNCMLIIVCGPGNGNCMADNGTPGCDDEACCETVCAADPYCCGADDGWWDGECVTAAIDLCGLEVVNDGCESPTDVGNGTMSFDNFGATTDGPAESGDCALLNSDVWFCYAASCTGFATVSLCGSSYDTAMTAYEGCGCPTTRSLACSDDDCGTFALESRLSFAVDEGASYAIRVGGYQGARGEGIMTIYCGDDPGIGARCGPDTGDCFSANGTPGCEDEVCCTDICTRDPYCCDVEWDGVCAGTAVGLCGEGFEACGPEAGDCAADNGTPGCSDEACCQEVCTLDSYCCLVEWDDVCADEALDCP